MKDKKIALVLFSGGLDSRVVAKMMEEQGFEIHLCLVKLPFGGGCCNNLPCILNFSQTQGYKLHIIDSTKGKKFLEYVKLVREPKHGVGASMNPCKDCKIFIFKEGKKLADEIHASVIVTGEVLGQRPMSQMKKALLFDDEKAGLSGKILRPLSAKVLPETDYEKKGLIDREKFFGIEGRRREIQMNLAEKYKIKYPSSGGGCLLCDKDYCKKLKVLFDYNVNPSHEEIILVKARMFKGKGLLFLGRNKQENVLFRTAGEKLGWNIFFREDLPGPTIIYDKIEEEGLVKELWEAYSKKDLKERAKFDKFKV
jgi:tRNA-uridine 2-sulfurtransferase